ncbi:uroporphyrinogen decarboxylase family protein [bacterium]|nr:uroporphyrinogen decarboxylase family protein [bacterium]
MSPASMTPKERFLAFLQGQPVDRLLCVPLILNHANRAAGLTVSQTCQNGPALGRAHADCYRKYGQDMVTLFTDTSLLAEAMGTKLKHFDDDAPRVETPVVQSPDDVARVHMPDPHSDGRLPVFLEAIRTANAEVGAEVFVACCFAMPFTVAAALMGTDVFVKATRKAPELAHRLLEMATEAALRFTDAVIAAGGVPVPVDPVASCSVIGPRQYAEFARPYTQRILERIAAAGLPPVLHICGHSHLIWDQMVDGGAAVLSLDKVDLAQAKAAVGARCCLMGNVPPAEVLLYGTPELVAQTTLAGIRAAADSPGGYIVASGCEVPLATPEENIHAMLQTVREYGKPG